MSSALNNTLNFRKDEKVMLTGKAKSDFEKWYWNDWLTGSDRDYHEKDEVIENLWKAEKMFLFPLIIEWLDSVGIYVNVSPRYIDHVIKYSIGDFYAVLNFKDGSLTLNACNYNSIEDRIYSRQQATEKAIEKANEIYNNSK